jgi:polyhydroxybutyrate depolymerase
MKQRNLRNRQPQDMRRFVAFVIIILSLSMLLGATVYAYRVQQHFTPKTGNAPSASRSLVTSPLTTTQPASTCKTPPHSTGDSNVSIISSGVKRTFIMHLPPSYGRQPQALVISYHGYTFTAERMAHYTNMAAEANKAGFMVVFPQGLDNPPSWNAGTGTGDANDVQFTRDLISYVEKNYCTDAHRIYITGFSLGGGMAYRIACTLTNQIAAVATVAGAYYHAPGGCHPSRPIPVLEIHGQADPDAPYNGNPGAGMAAVQAYLNLWLALDGCNKASQVFFHKGDVTGIEWTHCAAGSEVVHYRVSDGGHNWPGAATNFAGFTTHVIDANVVLWNFFSRYMSP